MVMFRDRIATFSDGAIRSLKTCSQCQKSRATNGQYPAHHVHPSENFAFIKGCMNGHLKV